MSILRFSRNRSHRIETFSQENNVVYDKGASDMPVLHELMLSGYTPSTRVAQYHTDFHKDLTDSEILESVTPRPKDITDIINKDNVDTLYKSVPKHEEKELIKQEKI